MSQTTERAFEATVEEILLTHAGWERGSVAEWDVERALFPARVFAFLQETQPRLWQEMTALHGIGLESLLIETLVKELNSKGTLHILRHGFNFYGKVFKLAYFKPAHGLNEEVLSLYGMNPVDGDPAGAVPSRKPRHGGPAVCGERAARGDL